MSLIIYPQYPAQLPRNYDYIVTVTQGDKSATLPVYNTSRQSNNFSNVKNSDAYRRFCEFAFTGEVTVSVKTRLPMTSYAILPSAKEIESSVENDTVTFTLAQPCDLVLRLNDDKNTILAIFAEAPETDIPDENDENVIYFKAGLNNSPDYRVDERGVMIIPENTTVYLEPGALVLARVHTYSSNVTVCGRGAFVDPRMDRNTDFTYMFYGATKKDEDTVHDITLKDVRFLDAHCFNICFSKVRGVKVDSVKLLSNQISTDGISFWTSVAEDIEITGVFMHITDNAFVCSSGTRMNAHNCFIGTDYGIFYPQGHITSINFENIDLFRCGNFFRATEFASGDRIWQDITVKNIRAADALTMSAFIYLRTQGTGEKNICMKDISLPKKAATVVFDRTDGCTFTLENVYINGKEVKDKTIFTDYRLENNTLVYLKGSDDFSPTTYRALPADFSGVTRIYIGGYLVPNGERGVLVENGEYYLPAEILKELNLKADNNTQYFPLSFFKDTLGLDVNAGEREIRISYLYKDENFITDPSFEDAVCDALPTVDSERGCNFYSVGWNTFDFAQLYCVDRPEQVCSGSRALRVSKNLCVGQTGVTHDLADVIKKCGAGVYHIKCKAKLGLLKNPDDTGVYMGLVQASWRIFDDNDKPFGINDFKEFTLTDEWQELSYDVVITDSTIDGYDRAFFFIGSKMREHFTPETFKTRYNNVMDFYVDDVSVTFRKETDK